MVARYVHIYIYIWRDVEVNKIYESRRPIYTGMESVKLTNEFKLHNYTMTHHIYRSETIRP